MAKKSPEPRDLEVSRRIRAFRLEKGFSQEKLADQLGLTFQQVQKYEKGTNRIGAGRLQRIAEILGVPVTDFFPAKKSDPASSGLFELVESAASLRMLRAFARIRDPQVRQAVAHLVEKIANS